jgi:proteasome lid subunit RPN8/RPN11
MKCRYLSLKHKSMFKYKSFYRCYKVNKKIMSFFKRAKRREYKPIQWKITKECLDIILEGAKSIYPKEFGGLLRVDTVEKYTIMEVVLLPGTISGGSQAIFKLYMLPIDFSIVGTVHSHPSGIPLPSRADLELFDKHGRIHIIVASPFDESSWKAYSYDGTEINISIVD